MLEFRICRLRNRNTLALHRYLSMSKDTVEAVVNSGQAEGLAKENGQKKRFEMGFMHGSW